LQHGEYVVAHRIAYELSKGPVPKELIVRHTCDNPPCCNPNHLIPGTDADNAKDKSERGRCYDSKGEANGYARLTSNDVITIRNRYSTEQIKQKDLAIEYGVSRSTIGDIIRRKKWKHL